jgi:hypothetical protein
VRRARSSGGARSGQRRGGRVLSARVPDETDLVLLDGLGSTPGLAEQEAAVTLGAEQAEGDEQREQVAERGGAGLDHHEEADA